MEILQNLQEVRVAYKKSNFWTIFKAVYSITEIKWKIIIWLSTVLSIISFITSLLNQKNNGYLLFFALSFFSYAFIISKGVEISYKKYYRSFGNLIKSYSKNRLFLRYLIFRSNVDKSLANDNRKIEKIRDLLKKENQLTNYNIFINNPVTTICLSIITAIFGGLASQVSNWDNGLMIIILIILIVIIFFNYQITELFQSKSYKTNELNIFLLWTSLEDTKFKDLF